LLVHKTLTISHNQQSYAERNEQNTLWDE